MLTRLSDRPIKLATPTVLVGSNANGKSTFLQAAMFALTMAHDARKGHRAFQEMIGSARRYAEARMEHRGFRERISSWRPRRSVCVPASFRAGTTVPALVQDDPGAPASIRSELISGGSSVVRDNAKFYSAEQLASLEEAWHSVAQMFLLHLAVLLGIQPIPHGREPVHRASAPCGVARLAAPTVPRAPGNGFAPSPFPSSCPA